MLTGRANDHAGGAGNGGAQSAVTTVGRTNGALDGTTVTISGAVAETIAGAGYWALEVTRYSWSFDHVCWPTMPSAFRPLAPWKALTAFFVRGPIAPSMRPV